MRKLLHFLDDYKKESILAPLFKMLEALFDLAVPLVVANIINNGLSSVDSLYLYKQFFLLIILALVGFTCSVTAQFFSARAAVGVTAKIRQALFDHIQCLSYTELDTLGTDTLITRMTSDCNQIQNGLNLTLRLLLRSPFIVLGAMIMAFTIDVKCAFIFAVAIPLLALTVFGIMLASIPMFRKVQSSLDNVLSSVRENLTGVRVIRAFRKEEDEVREFDEKNIYLTEMNKKVGTLSAFMNPVTYVIINIATIILIRCGALEVVIGNIAQGDVVALYNYMAQIVVELIKLASLIITIDKSLACADRVAAVFDIQPSMTYPHNSSLSDSYESIGFDHVTFTYAGASETSLNDISFSIRKGQTLGIIGSTGSGKSTLAALTARFYDADSGSVRIMGQNIKDYSEKDLRNIISIVPQKAVLFKGTIRDNMKYGNENATDEEIWKSLADAQAADVVRNKENELDYIIEQNGRNLSGGQKQRLTIARALLQKPQVLIMDDSASALDFATDAALRKTIAQLPMTTVIISQRTSSISHADLILVLDDGSLAGSGTHEELMKTCRSYQEIYYSQFPEEKPADFTMEVIA